MAKITEIGNLSLVKSAILTGKTGPRFRCLDISAILFTMLTAKCQGSTEPALSTALHLIFDRFD